MLAKTLVCEQRGLQKSASHSNLLSTAPGQQHPHVSTLSRLRPEAGLAKSQSLGCLAALANDVGPTAEQHSHASAAAKLRTPQQTAPFATITRILLVGQPHQLMRNLAARKWRAAGPVSLLLFLLGLVLACMSAVRSVLVRRVRACKCCKGYGITRCRLCDGQGAVEWVGKNNHQENCPLCMTKRYITCTECGGHYHRKMFAHIRAPSKVLVPEFLAGA
ncbi:hypothetical protein V8C86DRAFT_2875438 [Haematococcus lacustris]